MKLTSTARALLCTLGFLIVTPALAAQPAPEFVQFRPSATKGALYRPDPAEFPNAHIAVLVMHRDSNYMSHISTKELPGRGFYVLGMNPRCDNNEAACAPWENNALDVKQGIEYLRAIPGVTKVVLLGHSGGGPTMSFYQAVAENGPKFCQNPDKLIQCGDGFEGLPPADGLILMDSHPGNTINSLRSLNASVTNDAAILDHNAAPETDPSLDPFSATNGFSPDGAHYSADFIKAYTTAQAKRMNGLIDIASARLKEVEEKGLGDAAFVIPMSDGARLMDGDLAIHHATEAPRKLLKNDGAIVDNAPVESVRAPMMKADEARTFDATSFLTLKSFLSVRAIRSTDSMDGVDWCSSNNSTPCSLRQVSVPLLVTAMGGHYFIRDNEQIFEAAASKDKDFVVIEGATHGGTPCKPCEATPGQYGNATKNLFDLMASWMDKRY